MDCRLLSVWVPVVVVLCRRKAVIAIKAFLEGSFLLRGNNYKAESLLWEVCRMEINVRGKNIDVNPALRQYAEKRLVKLEKYIRHDPCVCQVTFSTKRGKYVVEVTIPLNGMILRAEESAQDAFASVDLVSEKLERQLEKYKTRLLKRDKQEIKLSGGQKEPETGKIVKVKRFAMKPMMPEEAALQMELLGHDFFVFPNGETGVVNVIYKRKDGNFGLIEPEY